jgi:hypothetical protein
MAIMDLFFPPKPVARPTPAAATGGTISVSLKEGRGLSSLASDGRAGGHEGPMWPKPKHRKANR